METLLGDIRYSARVLAKRPVFTIMAVLSLALGIGANTAIYSIVHAVLLKPLPVEDPARLVAITNDSIAYPVYTDFRDQNDVLTGLVAFADRQLNLIVNNQSSLVTGGVVSGNYFDVLGVRPAVGRTFLPEEDQGAGAQAVVVLSQRLWQQQMGGDGDVIGKSLNLNGQPFTVVGVAPRGFRGTRLTTAPDLWITIAAWPRVATGYLADLKFDSRNWSWLSLAGRLKPGVTQEQAEAAFNVLAHQQAVAYPKGTPKDFSVTMHPLTTAIVDIKSRDDSVRFLAILMAIVGIALAIACANVANLMLVRAAGRRKEMAIRLAMGASRSRIVRQLLTESVLLSVIGGAAGLLVAVWALDLLEGFELPGGVELAKLGLQLSPDVLAVTLALSLLTGLVFGLAPAIQSSRPDLIPALKDQHSGQGAGRSFLRNALVSGQVALCLLLLIGAGLCVRSLENALAINPGFNPEGVALASFNPGLQRYDEARATVFYRQLGERARSLPGVQSVSFASLVPVTPSRMIDTVNVQGYQPQPGERVSVHTNFVGSDYFRTMQIPLARGREFDDGDAEGAARVVIVSEAMAARYWPDQDPIGRQVTIYGSDATVVAVAKDAKYNSLRDEPKPFLYLPVAQHVKTAGLSTITILARADGDLAEVSANLRRAFHEIDPDLPLFGVQTLSEHLGDLLIAERFGATLFSMFGLLALLLAVAGIYGVAAYMVAERTHEIGIRMALGAQGSDILKMVMGRGSLPVLTGVAIGLVAALAITRFLASFLYGVTATDATVFIVASLIVAGTAVGACFVPARRATRVDPLVALRYE